VIVGNERWLRQHGITNVADGTGFEQTGRSVVHVAVQGRLRLLIGLTDKIRVCYAILLRRLKHSQEEAFVCVNHLKRNGFRVMIVTGDNMAAATCVANQVFVDGTS